MMDSYFCVSEWQKLSPGGIIASNLLFQQNCVFCLWQKAHGSSWELQILFQELQHCHSQPRCREHIITGQEQGRWQCWKNSVENEHQAKPLSTTENHENMVRNSKSSQKLHGKILPGSVALWETWKYGVWWLHCLPSCVVQGKVTNSRHEFRLLSLSQNFRSEKAPIFMTFFIKGRITWLRIEFKIPKQQDTFN